jgi:hypothetical protein
MRSTAREYPSAAVATKPAEGWPSPVRASWDPQSCSGRLVRAGVFAGASTALGVSAHRLAGGAVPGLTTITVAAGLLLLLGGVLSRRERSGPQLTVLVLVTQALLHLSFMLSTMSHTMGAGMSSPAPLSTAELAKMLYCFPGTATPSAGQVATAMSGMDTSHFTAATPATMHMAGQMNDNPFTAAGLLMLSAHLVAAAAMAWWLRRGERAAWTVIDRVITTLTTARVPQLAPNTPPRLQVVAELWLPTQQVWGSGRAGRGPPTAGRLNLLTA